MVCIIFTYILSFLNNKNNKKINIFNVYDEVITIYTVTVKIKEDN